MFLSRILSELISALDIQCKKPHGKRIQRTQDITSIESINLMTYRPKKKICGVSCQSIWFPRHFPVLVTLHLAVPGFVHEILSLKSLCKWGAVHPLSPHCMCWEGSLEVAVWGLDLFMFWVLGRFLRSVHFRFADVCW